MGLPPPGADPYSHRLSAPPSHHALVTIVSPPNQLQSTVYPTATARDLLPRPLPPGLSIIRPLPISAATTGRWFPVRQAQDSRDINLKVLVSQRPSHSLSLECDSLIQPKKRALLELSIRAKEHCLLLPCSTWAKLVYKDIGLYFWTRVHGCFTSSTSSAGVTSVAGR